MAKNLNPVVILSAQSSATGGGEASTAAHPGHADFFLEQPFTIWLMEKITFKVLFDRMTLLPICFTVTNYASVQVSV